jgi:hypothetical protein
MAEVEERKALDRLGRSLRNLINGDRLGAAEPEPEEPADISPTSIERRDAEPQSPTAPTP